MQMNRKFVLGSLLVFGAGLAYAADQTILGNTFLVKNPSTPTKRKIIGKAKESGSPNTIVGNPTATGGVLVVTANGGSPSAQTYVLPQGTSGITGKPRVVEYLPRPTLFELLTSASSRAPAISLEQILGFDAMPRLQYRFVGP